MWLVSAKHCQWEPLWYLERCRNPGRSVLINPNISRRVGRPLQRARACAVSTAVVRGSRGPRAVSKFHLCVRRSGVFGVEMKTLPCYACECGSHRYSPPPARLTGPMLPADEATWLKQLAEAERSRRAARSTLTASLSTDELLAARPPQPQALPLGHSQQE